MYQINIQRQQYNQPVDITKIRSTLSDLLTEDQDPHGYEQKNPESVWVRFGTVGEAVQRINELGYSTDEDDVEDEE